MVNPQDRIARGVNPNLSKIALEAVIERRRVLFLQSNRLDADSFPQASGDHASTSAVTASPIPSSQSNTPSSEIQSVFSGISPHFPSHLQLPADPPHAVRLESAHLIGSSDAAVQQFDCRIITVPSSDSNDLDMPNADQGIQPNVDIQQLPAATVVNSEMRLDPSSHKRPAILVVDEESADFDDNEYDAADSEVINDDAVSAPVQISAESTISVLDDSNVVGVLTRSFQSESAEINQVLGNDDSDELSERSPIVLGPPGPSSSSASGVAIVAPIPSYSEAPKCFCIGKENPGCTIKIPHSHSAKSGLGSQKSRKKLEVASLFLEKPSSDVVRFCAAAYVALFPTCNQIRLNFVIIHNSHFQTF